MRATRDSSRLMRAVSPLVVTREFDRRRHSLRGHIQTRGENIHRIYISLGKDPGNPGKYKLYTETAHGKKEEAQARLTELLHQFNIGEFADSGDMTFGEFLDYWLEVYPCDDSTRDCARLVVNKHIKPALGAMPLKKLTTLHIQSYFNKAKRRDGREGKLSANTLRGQFRVMHWALSQAVEWNLLARNPAHGAKPPREEKGKGRALTPAELARFIEVAQHYRYGLLYVTAAATGMRPGELTGPRWQDVDLDQGFIFVRQALKKPGRKPRFGEVKNETSRRLLRMPRAIIEALRKRKEQCDAEKAFFGSQYHDHDLVFYTLHGNPIGRSDANKYLDAILERAGIPHVRFHDMRHSNATWLLLSGVDVRTVAAHLGHAQTSTTLDIYAHVISAVQEQTANAIDGLFSAVQQEPEGKNVVKIRQKRGSNLGRSAANNRERRIQSRS